MPALVNYCGDDEFYSMGYAYSMDSSFLCSTGSHVEMYCSPRKRLRISAPYIREEEKKPSIEVLPDECLFEIFRRLPGGQERSACACASKHWLMLLSSIRSSEVCRNGGTQVVSTVEEEDESENNFGINVVDTNSDLQRDGFLTRCLEGKKATDIRLAAIAVGTAGHGGLGKLSIRGCDSTRGVTDFGLSAIARGCPSLTVLSLWNLPSVGDEGLFEIAKECRSLEKLDLCQCPLISNKGLVAIAENCPNLTALSIESCSNIGNESLQAIGRYCPKLQSITIRDSPHVGDQGVASLLSLAPALTKVKLQALSITDFSLAVIGHYGKALTSLMLSGLSNVSEKGFWVMGNAQGLQRLASLAVTSCRGATDVSLEAIGKGCKNLKQISLRKCCFVSDDGLVAFADAAISLESLQLEECNRITLSGILGALSKSGSKFKSLSLLKCTGIKDLSSETPIVTPCESLRSLSIQCCPGFSNASLALVGKLCPRLHHIDLSGLYGITDAGLLPLLEMSEAGLVKVNLSGCLNLTDEVVFALSRLHGETLEHLNLDGCWKITDASLVVVADNCPLLSDLDLSKCSITDSGIAALSRGEQLHLQILSLSGCSKVSGTSLPFLRKLGKTLVGLNVKHCNSISSGTVDLLVDSLWRCDILS